MLAEQFNDVSLEGPGAGQHLKENHAQRVDVASPVDRQVMFGLGVVIILFRAGIGWCAEQSFRVEGQAGAAVVFHLHNLGDPEVEHLELELATQGIPDDHDVFGLQVAMHDSQGMGPVEDRADLLEQPHDGHLGSHRGDRDRLAGLSSSLRV